MKTNRYLLRRLLSSFSLPILRSPALLLSTLLEVSLSLYGARADAHIDLFTRIVSDVNKYHSISIRVNIDQTDDEKRRYPCRGKQSSSFVYVAA